MAQSQEHDPAAIIADLRRSNADLQAERNKALAEKAALAEVLAVVNASRGDPQPVFDAILEKAHALCGAAGGSLTLWEGSLMRVVAMHNLPPELTAYLNRPMPAGPLNRVLIDGQRYVQYPDIREVDWQNEHVILRDMVQFADVRTRLMVPLRKDGMLLGFLSAHRTEVRLFGEEEIVLLENFASQAVLAMENSRLITETREALERQTATAEVLGVINTSPGNLTPVFNAVLEKSMRLCGAAFGTLYTYDGERFETAAHRGVPVAYARYRDANPPIPRDGSPSSYIIKTKRPNQIVDWRSHDLYLSGDPHSRAMADLGGVRTLLSVPFLKSQTVVGYIQLYRQEVRAFTDKEVALLENFAAQAVIAMENARLITEQREALERQTATAEVLGVINASPGNLSPVFDAILEKGLRLIDAAFGTLWINEGENMRGVASRGMTPALAAFRAEHPVIPIAPAIAREAYEARRSAQRLDMRDSDGYRSGFVGARAVVDLGGARTMLLVPLLTEKAAIGGIQVYRQEVRAFTDQQIALLENFAAQAVIAVENARLIDEIRTARDEAEAALETLQRTQDRLVQTEKMASLGQLTAGIAHEIKNPLNFVNNFSDLSTELLDELNAAIAPLEAAADPKLREEINELTKTLKANLTKIAEHGRRADSIVKNMLQHSRTGASERRTVNFNNLAEEALNLAYHGARAEIPGFNITMKKDFDPAIGEVELYPQEFTRVLLNLISNGFYATRKRAERAQPGYEPTLRIATRALDGQVEITVRDNGTGMPPAVREKIFEPFFTTKPAGEGTGLGLSLSFDIVVKQHGGQIGVDSDLDSFTEFRVLIPRHGPAEEKRP